MTAENRSVLSRPSPPPNAEVAYGDHRDAIADIRYAAVGTDRPLLVVVHGGYWRPETDRTHAGPMSAALAAEGWTVATIEYRRIPGSPDLMLGDLREAVERLPSLVGRHDGRVVLLGHSAGGHLVLWAAAALDAPQVVGTVALAPAADLGLADELAVGSGAVRAFLGSPASARPELDPSLIRTPPSPVTVVHGVDDSVAPVALSRSYVARHPTTRVVELPATGHFEVIDPMTTQWGTIVDEIRFRSAQSPA